MTPKRFKAVSVQNGKTLTIPPYSPDLEDEYTSVFGYIIAVCSNSFFKPELSGKVEICQSTGLTDSRGQEVYEGDVLACKCHADIAVVWVQGSEPEDPVAAWGWKYAHPDFGHVEYHNTFQRSGICLGRSVIGNKWMSEAELQAKAEAITASTSA